MVEIACSSATEYLSPRASQPSPRSAPKPSVADLLRREKQRKEAAARRQEVAKRAQVELGYEDYTDEEAVYWGLPLRQPVNDGGIGGGEEGLCNAPSGAPRMPDSMAWRRWAPGMRAGDLPPPAVAAMADTIAEMGISPSVVVSDLRSELAEEVAAGVVEDEMAASAAIVRLELELCRGPPLHTCVRRGHSK